MTKPSPLKPYADKNIFYCFLCLIFWLPLPLGSNRPWAWHLMEVLVFVLCIWYLRLLLYRKVQISHALTHSKSLFLCLVSFAIVIVIQLIPLPVDWVSILRQVDSTIELSSFITVSIDPYITWIHLRTTIAFMAIVFLFLALINTASRVRKFAVLVLCCGVLQATYGSLMTLSGIEYGFLIKKWTYLSYATGTFVNRNHFANYLVLCLAMGTGLLLSDLYRSSSKNWNERGQRIIQALLGNKARIRIGLALMVIALVLTKSRMGNTAFFFSLLFSGFIWLWLTRRITRGSIILLFSLLVIDSFIVGAWFGVDKVKERIETTAFAGETRDEANQYTWTMIQDQPLLGSGAGSFYTAFPRYRQGDIVIHYDHAHNDYFQFVAEYGVIGVIPLILLVLLSLKNSLTAMVKRKTLFFQAMAFVPLMSIVAMAMHSAVDFSLQIPANAATFICILSLSWVVKYVPSQFKNIKKADI